MRIVSLVIMIFICVLFMFDCEARDAQEEQKVLTPKKIEVDSNYDPLPNKLSTRGSRTSSANIYQKEKAVKTVQKFLRGYVVRRKIEKEKEIREFLDREKVEESIGEELKLDVQ